MTFHYPLRRFDEVRPLRLVEHQPVDALERARRLNLRFKPVNLTASPIPGVGGLGLITLVLLTTMTLPAIWLAALGSMIAGAGLGLVWIVLGRR